MVTDLNKFAFWIMVAAFGGSLVLIPILDATSPQWTIIPVLVVIAEIVAALVFVTRGNEGESIKVGIFIAFSIVAVIAWLNVGIGFLGAVHSVWSDANESARILQTSQPDVAAKTIGQMALGFEIALPFIVGFISYLILHTWLKLRDAVAVAIGFALYAFTRAMLLEFVIATFMAAGGFALLKRQVLDAGDRAKGQATKKGYTNIALLIGVGMFVCVGLYFSQAAVWMTGLWVIYSPAPFTTLSFLAQGFLVGGWFVFFR